MIMPAKHEIHRAKINILPVYPLSWDMIQKDFIALCILKASVEFSFKLLLLRINCHHMRLPIKPHIAADSEFISFYLDVDILIVQNHSSGFRKLSMKDFTFSFFPSSFVIPVAIINRSNLRKS